jgi:hypothetical protein
VLRGGSWNSNARNVRAANRNDDHPDNRNSNYGFRPARAQERQIRTAPDPIAVQSVVRLLAGRMAANSTGAPVCS